MQIYIIEAVLLVFLICIAVTILFKPDLFACTVLFCAFSFCAVLTYLIFGAADVAFTEAVIGTMSTVLFAITLTKVDRYCKRSQKNNSMVLITFFVIIALIAFFCFMSRYLPEIGDPTAPAHLHISNFYIEHSKADTAANNIVSGTLADYRGFDTMFETSVMFVSGVVVTLLLYKDKKHKHDQKDGLKKGRRRSS